MARGRPPRLPWGEIDPLLIAGALSFREIAFRYGCSERTLRKRIQTRGLDKEGPVTASIITNADQAIRRGDARKRRDHPPSGAEIDVRRDAIRVMVSTIVEVVGRHRERIHASQELVSRLFAELADVTEHTDDVQATIEADTKREDDEGNVRVNQRARNRMLRAVALPERAATVDRLASALEKLVKLERQAWNVPDIQPAEPPKHAEVDTPEVIQTLRALSATIRATSGKANATDLHAESVDPGAGQDREGAVPPFSATPAGPIA